MSRDDDRERGERPKLSWREIDQRREKAGGRRDERRPRGARAEAEARAASKSYLAKLDKQIFSGSKGGGEGTALEKAVREAHGSPGLGEACAAYLEALGPPQDPGLLSLFLDCTDKELVKAALQQLVTLQQAGGLSLSVGLRSQLRLLAEDSDDDVAYPAEDLLEGGS